MSDAADADGEYRQVELALAEAGAAGRRWSRVRDLLQARARLQLLAERTALIRDRLGEQVEELFEEAGLQVCCEGCGKRLYVRPRPRRMRWHPCCGAVCRRQMWRDFLRREIEGRRQVLADLEQMLEAAAD